MNQVPDPNDAEGFVRMAMPLVMMALRASGKMEVQRQRGGAYHYSEFDQLIAARPALVQWINAVNGRGSSMVEPQENGSVLGSIPASGHLPQKDAA